MQLQVGTRPPLPIAVVSAVEQEVGNLSAGAPGNEAPGLDRQHRDPSTVSRMGLTGIRQDGRLPCQGQRTERSSGRAIRKHDYGPDRLRDRLRDELRTFVFLIDGLRLQAGAYRHCQAESCRTILRRYRVVWRLAMRFPGRGGQVKATETRQQTSFRAFINKHAVLTFYILVFALTLTSGTLIAFLG